MLNFENQTLDINELPKFEDVEGHPIDKAYLKVLRLLFVFWLIFCFGGLFLLNYLVDLPKLAFFPVLGFLILIFSFSLTEIEKGFPRRKFGIREKDIIFQQGYFMFKQTILPYKRIQHVEVKQGPLFKAFKIYTLKVFTAGSSSGDLSIAGLNKDDASKLKAQILKAADLDNN
jgi:membrane protein YdbS with pleckstrin-like domain